MNKNNFRLLSLDVFRGITIALMILVNSPGNQTAYAWLSHSIWNGCTLADMVFPFFLFIVGVSLVFSLSKSLEQKIPTEQLFKRVTKRAITIFLIGLFLNAFPYHFHLDTIRVYGVLQRIAICYFIASLLFLKTPVKTQAIIFIVLLIVYWLMIKFIYVPNYGIGNLTLEGNLAGYIDRLLFSSEHLYEKVFDPEGVLSTIPAVATTLLGNLTGTWLLTKRKSLVKLQGMTIIGIIALLLGWFWGLFFPINKNLWSSSYVLWTGGLALILLAVCYWLIEIKQWKKWSKPFEIFGLNAIAAYFLHIFFLKIQAMIHISRVDGSMGNLRFYITEHLFGWTTHLKAASLMYAFLYLLFWLLVLGILYRNKLFIRI
ncbi:MAG: heparan-alpha-glucosaminide N-acetyltransferase domain-containing protein [Gammaproteobacteria bacterium]